jgi:hypothetical protein
MRWTWKQFNAMHLERGDDNMLERFTEYNTDTKFC